MFGWLCATPQFALVFPSKGPGSTSGVGSTLKIFAMSNFEKGKVFPPGTRKAKRMASPLKGQTLWDTWLMGRRRAGEAVSRISALSRRLSPRDCMSSCCTRRRTTWCRGCKRRGSHADSSPIWVNLIIISDYYLISCPIWVNLIIISDCYLISCPIWAGDNSQSSWISYLPGKKFPDESVAVGHQGWSRSTVVQEVYVTSCFAKEL